MSVRNAARDDHSFLVLRENRLAFTAVTQLVSAKTGVGSVPVTLYGPAGSGKSHLVRHAIRAFREAFPQERTVHLTALQFADEFATASDSKGLAAFVRKYRVATGLFICEDLQALDNRRETQEQFIALWNDLIARETRILVTLNRSPGELKAVSPRLVNRLQGGACIGIARYGAASREKLLSHLAQSGQIPLTAEQSRRMTKTNPLNGHEMAGVIASMRLRLKSKPAAGVSATIDELLDEQPAMQGPSANDIAKAVAAVFGAKVADLRSDVRDRRLAVPRQLAMHAMREIGHFQYGEIGSYFGGRTHSTVLHSCKRIASELDASETLRWQFDQVCRRLKGSALENA